ncbi:MAG: YggS family pyridoxal phosphate-dependent enzyme [Actinomycetota bacterium]|nr:YggS family pyridoxal phosphate-dependent enzyme [Actinomycetota bacterium]
MSIYENIQSVRKRIEGAAKRSGRHPDEIILVAVTKNQPVTAIKEVIESGIADLGENRSQELLPKHEAIGDAVNWHFIGHLQRNKVKYIIPFVYLVQSVDSIALAKEIDKRAGAINKVQNILLEVNVSGEKSKYGFSPDDLVKAVNEMGKLENISINGLMTMAPFIDNTELLRSYFAKMKELFDNLSRARQPNLKMRYLSMGMTNDFEIAIEQGSNMVRIGTAIFSP